MQFTSLSTLAFADIAASQLSSATAFWSMMTQMTMGMGVAAGAIALRFAALLKGHGNGAPTIAEFHIAFAMVSVIAFLAVIDCFGLDPHAGAEASGRRVSRYPRDEAVEA